MERLTRAQLLRKREDGTYLEYVRSAMTDFCFTVDHHSGRDRAWFGTHTVTVNRNVSFHFFDHDVGGDSGLEPHPVVRGEEFQARKIRLLADAGDPSSAYDVILFTVERASYDDAVRSLDEIAGEYEGLRTLPDSYFPDSPALRLLRERLLVHPEIQAERESDWPPLPGR